MPGGLLKIGEVAERVGLSLRTVRYYEELGLLEPERRTDGGFRLYSETQVDRLLLIKRMKPLGFTVQEMGELLRARDALAGGEDDAAARAELDRFAAATGERIEELRRQLAYAEEFAALLAREAR